MSSFSKFGYFDARRRWTMGKKLIWRANRLFCYKILIYICFSVGAFLVLFKYTNFITLNMLILHSYWLYKRQMIYHLMFMAQVTSFVSVHFKKLCWLRQLCVTKVMSSASFFKIWLFLWTKQIENWHKTSHKNSEMVRLL